jgi:mycothiol synthase
MMVAKAELLIRGFQWDDLPAMTDLYNTCQEYDNVDGRTTLAEMENEFRSPNYAPEQEYVVVYNPEGTLVAYGFTEKATIPNRAWAGTIVHPDYRRQGLGTRLLRMTDTNFFNRVADQVDRETPIYIQRWTPEIKKDAIAVLEKEGYQMVRTFYAMRIELDTPLQPVRMPDGFEIRPFNPETDAYRVYQAQQEAFRDHWGYVQDVPYEEEWRFRLTDPLFDASMWYIAYAGDEIAGVSLCSVWGEDIPDLAWVGNLGVRRAYRKHGLATALLKHSFYEFQQRGFKKAGLGVDAANPTGAVGLYERAGMYVYKRGFSYRKVLRGNAALIQD